MSETNNKPIGKIACLGLHESDKISKLICPFADLEESQNILPSSNTIESIDPANPSKSLELKNEESPTLQSQTNNLPSNKLEEQCPNCPNIAIKNNLECSSPINNHTNGNGSTLKSGLELNQNSTYNIRANQYSICMNPKTIRTEEFDFCKKKIRELKLPMRLIQTSYLEEDKRLIFFFTAPERVDFRELLRILRQQYFGIRIELRQIGQRDAASLLGGIGICGCELCCCSFLRSFSPITAKIAKKVGPTPNPAMYCGLCGRLRCCLRYEENDNNGENDEDVENDTEWKLYADI